MKLIFILLIPAILLGQSKNCFLSEKSDSSGFEYKTFVAGTGISFLYGVGSTTITGLDSTKLFLGKFAPLASPTFTGTTTIPTPFTLGAISVTTTGTQLNYLNAATGTTGTTSTNLVFSTSPSFTTPVLGTPSSGTLDNCTGKPALSDSAFKGVNSAPASAAGQIGEIITSKIAKGSAVSLTTNTAANITSIALTNGYWLVSANVNDTLASATTATTSRWVACINTVSAVMVTDGTERAMIVPAITTSSNAWGATIEDKIVNVSTATTAYLVQIATFSAGTVKGWGSLTAVRIH